MKFLLAEEDKIKDNYLAETTQEVDNLPEDIIKKIKRYYSSGRLYENRKG